MGILLVIVLGFGLIGCSKTQTPTAASPQSPASDKSGILKQAALDYFNNMPPSFNLIDAPGLKAKLSDPDKIFLLDIRKTEDFAVGHIPGSVNIPFQELGKKFDSLPKNKQIIVICYTGQTAGQAIVLLKINGLDALSLLGGFPEWADNNHFPVEKG